MSGEVLYKVLGSNGAAFHGGTGIWHLPKGKRPGKWMPAIPNPEPCKRGYHVVRLDQLSVWFGPRIWTVEVRGQVIDHSDKLVAEQARLFAPTLWDERRARLFAADCAEHVLHLYEQRHPDDQRPRQAIEVARRFAEGQATRYELVAARDAAGDAAGATAWAAAGAAAGDAARAAARAAARDAAGTAAWAAAWGAARAAVWAAAWDAERTWQTDRLRAYLYDDDVAPLTAAVT